MTKSGVSLLCHQNPPIRKGKCVRLLRKLNKKSDPIHADHKKPNNPRKPRTALSLLIDRNVALPMAKIYYRNKAGVSLKKGRITRDGIVCDCCLKTFALTAFETHAGSTNHRPAAFIILDDGSGRSLSDCHKQVDDGSSSLKKKVSKVQINGQYNPSCGSESPDHVCSVCGDGEELIVCQQCPAAFHL
ncbi:Zinc finger, RING/FYVE/PHD-type, partial [Corchorus capsularis]